MAGCDASAAPCIACSSHLQATYDPAAREFVINTPNNEASKYWIGGSGQHGKICAVFAQLTVAGVWQGPHVFMVRIRDDQLRLMPGVRIKDHGPKVSTGAGSAHSMCSMRERP
jgi:alkylation response protein AidB-like acyl-CoA dehydrogenase